MNLRRKLNHWWRSIMWRMTSNIGVSHVDVVDGAFRIETVKRILICRPNHRLGNQLLITPLVQEVTETFPGAQIDLFLKGTLGPALFKNYGHVGTIIQLPARPFSNIFKYTLGWIKILRNHYDLVINAVHHSSSGRLATKWANSKYRCFGDIGDDIKLKHEDYEHTAKGPVYSFRNYLSSLGVEQHDRQVAPLNLKLSSSEISAGRKILTDLVDGEKRTICIFTHATRGKCYSQSWWEEFYEQLLARYPDYNILEVLPAENISRISFKAPAFYSRDIRQIGSLIANSVLFIGADSGMMHLASSSQATTVGLFKVTNPKIFGPYGNESVAIDTNKSSTVDCIEIITNVLGHVQASANPS